MPRGPAPQWKRRLEPILDDYVKAAMDSVGNQFNPETGLYSTLVYANCETRDRAKEISQALYRSGRHLKVSVHTDIKKNGSGYNVEFSVFDKKFARAYVVNTYGEDRSKWAYDPRKKNEK